MSGHAAPAANVAVAKTQGGGWAAVGLLATCMFVVGTSELVITGILPVIAQDLNTPIATAGYLVAAYALSFAVVTPIVAAVTRSVDRRRMLLACLAGFVAASALATVAASFEWLVAARVLAAAASGVFEVVATAVAAALVMAHQRGRAVALVISGFSVALLVGVPAGTLIGQSLGWRVTFSALFILGGLAAGGVWLLLPRVEQDRRERPGVAMAGALRSKQVVIALATTALAFTGVYVAMTFIAVFLERITHVPPEAVAGVLLLVGLGSVIGNAVGGYAIDHWGVRGTLVVSCLMMITAMVSMSALGSFALAMGACCALNGAGGGIFIPAQQARLIKLAPRAPELALAINLSALNAGISVGAALASGIVDRGGLAWLGYASAALATLALGLAVGTRSTT
jgi:predicted MFS family arabinose efflux permease